MARPTKYNQKLVDTARAYIDDYAKCGDAMPSIAGLAVVLSISRETIHTWRHEEGKEEFSDILALLLSTQERVLMNNGLTGEFNSAITKLALGKHGYSEKVDTDWTSGGEKIVNEWHVHPVTTANGKG